MAASLTKPMKLTSSLSYGVAIRRKEEALDDIALHIEIDVVGALDLAVSLGRDDDLGSGFGDLLAQMIGVIALVADRGSRTEAIDELVCESDVVALPRCTNQT